LPERDEEGVRADGSSSNRSRRKFGDIQGTKDGGPTDTDTKNNPTNNELWKTIAGGNEYRTDCEARLFSAGHLTDIQTILTQHLK
jgi:hypothetical protein